MGLNKIVFYVSLAFLALFIFVYGKTWIDYLIMVLMFFLGMLYGKLRGKVKENGF